MKGRKLAGIDRDFEETARKMFPFAKSLYHVTKLLNERLEKELYGVTNATKKKR